MAETLSAVAFEKRAEKTFIRSRGNLGDDIYLRVEKAAHSSDWNRLDYSIMQDPPKIFREHFPPKKT